MDVYARFFSQRLWGRKGFLKGWRPVPQTTKRQPPFTAQGVICKLCFGWEGSQKKPWFIFFKPKQL